jgi:hypothetical protein
MRAFIVLFSLIVLATSQGYNGGRGGGAPKGRSGGSYNGGAAPHVAVGGRSAPKGGYNGGARGGSVAKARSVGGGYNGGARGASAAKARSVRGGYNGGARGGSVGKARSVRGGGYNGGARGASVAKGVSFARKAISKAIKGRSRKGGYGAAPAKAKSATKKVIAAPAYGGAAPKAKSASKPAPKPAVQYGQPAATTTAATTAAITAATTAATTTTAAATTAATTTASGPIITTPPAHVDVPVQLKPVVAPKYAAPCTTRSLEQYQEELLCLSRYVEKLAYAVAAHQEVKATYLSDALNAQQQAVVNDVNAEHAGHASERFETSGERRRDAVGAASRSSNVGTNPDGSLTGGSIGLIVGCILGAAVIAVVIIAFSVVRKRKIEMMQKETPLLMDHQ